MPEAWARDFDSVSPACEVTAPCPNPFKYKADRLKVDPKRAIRKKGFASRLALVAALWQRVEVSFGYVFAFMLGGKETAALEIYGSLIDRNLRKQAFTAAAQDRLPRQLLTEGVQLYERARRLSGRRNDVVHALWTTLDLRATSIFRIDERDELRYLHNMLRPEEKRDDFIFTLTEYTITDLDKLIEDIERFTEDCKVVFLEELGFVMLGTYQLQPLPSPPPPPHQKKERQASGSPPNQASASAFTASISAARVVVIQSVGLSRDI